MTTAELIKKREEEKNLQVTQPSFSSMVVKPDPTNVTIPVDNSVNREYARNTAQEKSVNRQIEAGNAPETSDAALDALKKAPELERVSLYEVGKANAATGIANDENSVKNPSPINTKEMEDFRNQVIGVRDFGLETPDQAERRERNAFIKQGLTGLTEGLSSLANLYYTTKWAPNQKMVSQMPALQQRLYRERLERDKKLENFRAWQRAKADKKEERAYQEALFDKKQEAANKAADLKHKRDVLLAEIKHQLELGKIDKKKAADLEVLAFKAKNAEDLAKINFGYDVALKKTSSAADDKVVDSIQVGENVYTRNTRLTDNELRTLAKYNQHPEEYTKFEGGDEYLGIPGKEVFDWKSAAINAINSGNVPTEVLEQMGFKKGKTSKKGKSLPGVGEGKKGKLLNL